MFHERHWTIEEAEAAREFVGEQLRALREARRRIALSRTRYEIEAEALLSGGSWPGREYAAAAVQLTLGLEWLAEADIVIRDLEEGIVDFPTLIDGEEAYLCWREGEPSITHWHAPETGFTGRQPL